MSGRRVPENPVLLVDDEQAVIDSLALVLRSRGIDHVLGCTDSREVMGILHGRDVDLVLLDLAMPHLRGSELLPCLHEEMPQVPVIVVTGTGDVAAAVECMKAGAFDYMVKPVEENRLVSGVRSAIEIRRLSRDYRRLKEGMLSPRLSHPEAFSRIVTANQVMRSLFRIVESVARTDEPVLITGETGTGKGLLAGAIHAVSGREGAMVTVNIGGLDESMFSDTLFGHLKGAFTTASDSRKGMVSQAGSGTLFLDEIGDLPGPDQVKLLQLLDTGEYYTLGADVPRRSTARVLVASNRDLAGLVSAGKFRKDLYYRLSTHELRVPPLRERRDDIPLLVDHFVREACEKLGRKKPQVPAQALELLSGCSFPGNVRELRSIVHDAVSRQAGPQLLASDFRSRVRQEALLEPGDATPAALLFPGKLPTLEEAADLLVDEAMRRAGGNQTVAARMLGISHQALNKRLHQRASRQQGEGDQKRDRPSAGRS